MPRLPTLIGDRCLLLLMLQTTRHTHHSYVPAQNRERDWSHLLRARQLYIILLLLQSEFHVVVACRPQNHYNNKGRRWESIQIIIQTATFRRFPRWTNALFKSSLNHAVVVGFFLFFRFRLGIYYVPTDHCRRTGNEQNVYCFVPYIRLLNPLVFYHMSS